MTHHKILGWIFCGLIQVVPTSRDDDGSNEVIENCRKALTWASSPLWIVRLYYLPMHKSITMNTNNKDNV